MFVVDTNVLLHAVNPDSPDHDRAKAAIETWRRGERSGFLTWGIVYEFLRVSTHRAVFPKPLKLTTARSWIAMLLAGSTCGLLVETERHAEVLAELAGRHARVAGNLVHDLHTATLMREHGVSEIWTADMDFHQFPFLRVVDPLMATPESR